MSSVDTQPEPAFQAVEANSCKDKFNNKKETCIQSFNSCKSYRARSSMQWTKYRFRYRYQT